MKKKRIEDKSLLQSFKTMHCLVCSKRGCDPAHIKTKGSGGDDDPSNLMPLCRIHHSEQHNIGIVTFAEKYQSVLKYIKSHGFEIQNQFGRKKLIKNN